MKILVTGCAGFIGIHVSKKLLDQGHDVIGLDVFRDMHLTEMNMLRNRRLDWIQSNKRFRHEPHDLNDNKHMNRIFTENTFDVVIHLAADAGIRKSMDYPEDFTRNNLVGFSALLELCRKYKIPHLLFASSSSVYGDAEGASSEDSNTNFPKSYYAATKKANEAMAFCYSHQYNMRITGMRFFTVYGPWGRPDMAPWKFADAIMNRKTITLYDHGRPTRDFTYVEDTADCVLMLAEDISKRPHLKNIDKFQIYNIGNGTPVSVMSFLNMLESEFKLGTDYTIKPLAASEAQDTHCDMTKFKRYISAQPPHTSLKEGVSKFV
jgi:UDP-glucuronate 4-epimerase